MILTCLGLKGLIKNKPQTDTDCKNDAAVQMTLLQRYNVNALEQYCCRCWYILQKFEKLNESVIWKKTWNTARSYAVKFLRTPFLTEHLRWLLLDYLLTCIYSSRIFVSIYLSLIISYLYLSVQMGRESDFDFIGFFTKNLFVVIIFSSFIFNSVSKFIKHTHRT